MLGNGCAPARSSSRFADRRLAQPRSRIARGCQEAHGAAQGYGYQAPVCLLVRNDCLNFKRLCLGSRLRSKSRLRNQYKAIGREGGVLAVHLFHPFNIRPTATGSTLEPNEDYIPINLGLDADINLTFPASRAVQEFH